MKATIIQNLIISTFAVIAISCSSSDDGTTPPPPNVDCNATGPSISLAATDTECGVDNGTIDVTITGGTGNLQVTIDPQPLDFDFSSNTFTALEPGTYTVQVTDADNCAASESTVVGMTGGGVSYMNDVDPIVQANCAIPSCHDGSNAALPDYTVFANFQQRANNDPLGIRQRVKTNDMPRSTANNLEPGDPLSDAEKEILFCWIDEGAQDN